MGVRMGSVAPYSRERLRRLRRAWIRTNRVVVGGLTAGLVVLLVVAYLLIVVVGTPSSVSWWLLGAMQVGAVGAYLHLLQSAFLAHDREAIWQVRGSWGEENTRSELASARRRRIVWGSVDSISLQHGDLDHVAVLRRGGVVVLDSKWRSELTDLGDVVRSAQRARTRARGILRTVSGAARSGPLFPVTAVVVVRGPAQHDLGAPRVIEDVTLVPGRQLRSWMRQMEGEAVPRAAARQLLARLDDYGAGTRRDRATRTPRWRHLTAGASAPSAR